MNRAMFSGVAGMKAHQTKMDVIGNNIANVNTYGYKAQRAVFSDIYYQTLRGASGGSSSRGGINPSSVGYGSTLSSVQTQMSQSSMQNTGFGMDVAITGEGFLQVMDPDGNIFYTKAGMLDYDANGYLTDINGNFVLGATDVDGKPGTQKIKLDNIGSVDAKQPADTQFINGINFTVTASNAANSGNVAFNIGVSENLPAGQKAAATISATGGITVQLNASEKFSSMSELNQAVNDAIIEANGGKTLAAGTFTISADQSLFGTSASSGTFTGSAAASDSTFRAGEHFFSGAFDLKSFKLSDAVTTDEKPNFKITSDGAATPTYTITTNIKGKDYTATFQGGIAQGSSLVLKTGAGVTPAGSITLNLKDKSKLSSELAKFNGDPGAQVDSDDVTLTAPQYFLGGSKITSVSSNFNLSGEPTFSCSITNGKLVVEAKVGGTTYTNAGDPFALGSAGSITLKVPGGDDAVNGTITMSIPSKADMLSRLGVSEDKLADALNDSASEHSYKLVAASAGSVEPLTGAEIAGGNFGVTGGKVEGMDALFGGMTFLKTSSDFTGSGTVNSVGATYHEGGGTPYWTVGITVDGKTYSADISQDTKASSILLKSAEGDYIQVSNPGYDAITDAFQVQNGGNPPAEGETAEGLSGGKELTITPSTQSRELGLSTVGFALSGGTEGGSITLDQLSSISIGSDGTIIVNHAEKGTVAAGKISLATFSNPAGLQLVGNNYYTTTANSGEAKLADPGSGGTGALKNSALEMSNVDLSAEFADMITTQRGFQANSRIITVSDSMLEELINLKR